MTNGKAGNASLQPLPIGKLPVELLETILKNTPGNDERVIVGPGIGLDCAVIEAGDRLFVLKSDPITFAAEDIGWYAIQVNANDLATAGAMPRWMLVTLLLPEGETTTELVIRIQEQLVTASKKIGATIIGGHTEITHGLDRVIVAGTMIGEVENKRLITPRGAVPGDQLLLTKSVPIEATAILANEFAEEIRSINSGLDRDAIKAGRNYLYDPGISVLNDARIAIGAGDVHAMHDPTEGGLYNAAWELAQASGCTLWIDPDLVPVTQLSRRICKALDIDPLGAISSGALLIAAADRDAQAISTALDENDICCTHIGGVVEKSATPAVYREAGVLDKLLPRVDRDEIARLFDE